MTGRAAILATTLALSACNRDPSATCAALVGKVTEPRTFDMVTGWVGTDPGFFELTVSSDHHPVRATCRRFLHRGGQRTFDWSVSAVHGETPPPGQRYVLAEGRWMTEDEIAAWRREASPR